MNILEAVKEKFGIWKVLVGIVCESEERVLVFGSIFAFPAKWKGKKTFFLSPDEVGEVPAEAEITTAEELGLKQARGAVLIVDGPLKLRPMR